MSLKLPVLDKIASEFNRNQGVEGNFSLYPKKSKWLFDLVKDLSPKRILEIGFNAGHSSGIMLSAVPDVELISFDNMSHNYTEKGFKLIKEFFPQVELVKGNSIDTLPEFISSNPTWHPDVILIDGGHTYKVAHSDLTCAVQMAGSNTVFIVDDLQILDVERASLEILGEDFDEIGSCTDKRPGTISTAKAFRRKK